MLFIDERIEAHEGWDNCSMSPYWEIGEETLNQVFSNGGGEADSTEDQCS